MRTAAVLAAFSVSAMLQAADPALMNLVMPNATVLAGINVQKAKTSPFGQFILQQMPAGSDLDKFVAETGFDPRQDVTEVLMASAGTSVQTGAMSMKGGLVLARGTFNTSQIEAAVAKDGKHTTQTYNGAQLITATTAGDGGAIAFLPSGIALAGDLASVKGALDRRNAANSVDPALAAKVASFIAADAWSVSIAPGAQLTGPLDGNSGTNPIAGVLKTVLQASGSVTFSSPVLVTAEAVAKTDQDATSLSDVIKFVASMMQSDQGAAGPWNTILQTITVTTDHSTVRVTASIPEDQIENAIKEGAKPKATKLSNKPAAHV